MFSAKVEGLLRLILMVVLVVLVSGCYEVRQEVIRASDAVAVDGLPGTYNSKDSKARTEIMTVPNSNDYRFQEITSEATESGYLRAVPLYDDIYISQTKYDNSGVYYIQFYRFTRTNDKGYASLSVSSPIFDLAQEHGIEVGYDDFAVNITLEGKRQDILAFLRAHKNLSLE